MNKNSVRTTKKEEKIYEYSARHLFWTDKALTQLGFSINLFITIGITTLGYLIINKERFLISTVVYYYCINLKFIYFASIFLTFTSIVFGCKAVISRLYDFRITRHIALVRKRALARRNKYLSDENVKTYPFDYYLVFLSLFCEKIGFIEDLDYMDKKLLLKKFLKLRIQALILGELTYIFHKIQIGLYLISVSLIALFFL